MKRISWVLLAGCAGSSESPDPEVCSVTATVVWPEGDELFGGGPVEVELSESDPDASFDEGTTYTRGGNIVGFWPDAPYAADSEVTVTLQTCAGPQSFTFQTTAAGAPSTVDLPTTSFDVDLGDLNFLRPASFSALIGLAPGVSTRLLIGAVNVSGSTATLRVAIADGEGAQDPCSRTVDVEGVQIDRGYLVLPPTDLSFQIGDATLDLRGLTFTAAVAADGSALSGGALSTHVEVEGMAALWAGGDVDAACDFFDGLQMPCVDCPDGGQCLVFDAAGLTGPAVAMTPAAVAEACPE